jgi:hypothetical protein
MMPCLSSDKLLSSVSAEKPPAKPKSPDNSKDFSRVIAAEYNTENANKKIANEKTVSENGNARSSGGKELPLGRESRKPEESLDEILGDETFLFSDVQPKATIAKGISSIDLSLSVGKDGMLAKGGELSESLNLTLLTKGVNKVALDGRSDQSMPLALSQLSDINLASLQKTEVSVPIKVGSADWGDAIAGRISLLVNQRINSARIQLTPPELGPIEVRINLNSEQASVQFISHSS